MSEAGQCLITTSSDHTLYCVTVTQWYLKDYDNVITYI